MKHTFRGKTQKINPRQLNINTIIKKQNSNVYDKNDNIHINSDIIIINNILNNDIIPNMSPNISPNMSPNNTFTNNKYKIVKYLGEGIQGSLYLANDANKKRYICKKIMLHDTNPDTNPPENTNNIRQIELELNLLKYLSSNKGTKEYINPCLDYKIIDNNIFTIFPVFDGYSLNHLEKYLRKLDHSSYYKIVFHLIKTILHGLAKIHQSKIAHQNINKNSLLVSTYTKPKEISIKFTDFGLGCGNSHGNGSNGGNGDRDSNMIDIANYNDNINININIKPYVKFNSCKANNFTPVLVSEQAVSDIVDNDYLLISQKYDLFCLGIIFAKLLLFFENLNVDLQNGYNKENEQQIIDVIDTKYLSKINMQKGKGKEKEKVDYESLFPYISINDDKKDIKQDIIKDIIEYLTLFRKNVLCKTANRQTCQYVLDKIIIYEKYKNEVF